MKKYVIIAIIVVVVVPIIGYILLGNYNQNNISTTNSTTYINFISGQQIRQLMDNNTLYAVTATYNNKTNTYSNISIINGGNNLSAVSSSAGLPENALLTEEGIQYRTNAISTGEGVSIIIIQLNNQTNSKALYKKSIEQINSSLAQSLDYQSYEGADYVLYEEISPGTENLRSWLAYGIYNKLWFSVEVDTINTAGIAQQNVTRLVDAQITAMSSP